MTLLIELAVLGDRFRWVDFTVDIAEVSNRDYPWIAPSYVCMVSLSLCVLILV